MGEKLRMHNVLFILHLALIQDSWMNSLAQEQVVSSHVPTCMDAEGQKLGALRGEKKKKRLRQMLKSIALGHSETILVIFHK